MVILQKNPHKAIYQGFYYVVIPVHMVVPKAMFLSEDEAIKYSDDKQIIRCLPLPASLFLQVPNQYFDLP